MTLEDYLSSRWVSYPYRLLDCCLETDGAAALLMTTTERAHDLRGTPVYVMGVTSGLRFRRTIFPIARISPKLGSTAARPVRMQWRE